MHRNKQKKGVSTIVAAIFMIMIIIVGLNVMTFALNSQNNFAQVMTEKSISEAERIKEDIEIRDVKINNNKFDISLANTGGLPVKLVRMWVTDETANSQTRYDINDPIIVNPKEIETGIGQGTPSLPAQITQSYAVKAVTERGSIVSFRTVAASQANNLQLVLTVIPPTVIVGQDATIILTVINNMYDAQAVHNLSPTLGQPVGSNCGTPTTNACPNLQQIGGPGPDPSSVESLPRGSTATFKWQYNIGQSGSSSSAGAVVTFTATLAGQSVSANLTVSAISLESVPFASVAGTLTIEYESLAWLQDYSPCPTWSNGWKLKANSANGWTAFKIMVTNHSPDNDIIMDYRTVFFFTAAATNNNQVIFFIIMDKTSTCGSNSVTAYTYDAANPGQSPPPSITITRNGGQRELMFAAKTAGGSTAEKLINTGTFAGSFVVLGKLGATMYAQNIPFMGIEVVP